mmetsp:Transcript_13052/g.14679  ORF Transcript_13052/g.14679 Transcript_13052/m.14679 type:complete len:86 (+) Transcript_13052:190-447(+)
MENLIHKSLLSKISTEHPIKTLEDTFAEDPTLNNRVYYRRSKRYKAPPLKDLPKLFKDEDGVISKHKINKGSETRSKGQIKLYEK